MSVAVPVLETPRLTLRGWRETDFPGFAAFCADEATRRFIPGAETGPKAWQRMCGLRRTLEPARLRFLGAGAQGWRRLCRLCRFLPPARLAGARTRLGSGVGASRCRFCHRSGAAHSYVRLSESGVGRRWSASSIPKNHPSVQVALRLGATHERDHELRDMRLGGLAPSVPCAMSRLNQPEKKTMALKIRLTRGGAKKRPYYRIIVADSRLPARWSLHRTGSAPMTR